MRTSEQIDKIAPALLSAQREIHNPKKTATNPFFNSKYATLEDVLSVTKSIYNNHGISIIQDIGDTNGMLAVSTILLHESGQWIQQDGMKLPNEKLTAQSAGSAVTYGRRYTLQAIAGISSEEDDDGNGAQPAKQTKSAPSPEPISDTPEPEPIADTPAPEPIPDIQEEVRAKLRSAGVDTLGKLRKVLAAFGGDVVAMDKAGEFFKWDIPEMIKAQEVQQ
jgi:hypothetical protein